MSVMQEGDKAFYQKLQEMVKDKRYHIRSSYEDKKGSVLKAPAGKPAAAYRVSMADGKGRKPFAEGGPYGYQGVGKKGEVPAALKDQTPGFFKLKHYAATVTYDVRDWVDKDLDKLSDDSYAMIESTQLSCFMKDFFLHKREKAAQGATVARDFANSLNRLVTTLQHTECNFVRCLKASNPLTRNVFKNALVLNQLKYTGMLDTLLIRRGGSQYAWNSRCIERDLCVCSGIKELNVLPTGLHRPLQSDQSVRSREWGQCTCESY